MNINIKRALIPLFILFFPLALLAKVQLPSILADNMVLQQKTNVKLWGKARPKTKIVIKPSWALKGISVQSEDNGNWKVLIPTPSAGGPYEITFSDGETVILKNILIGEVWFCSGQSNMEMPMKGFDRQPVAGTNNIIAKAKPTLPIRMYIADSEDGKWVRQQSKEPKDDCFGKWYINSPESVANTSAAAYFFAKYIQEVLDVPVGIVISSLGGSKVEAWMSREILEPFKEINLSVLDNKDEIKNPASTPSVLYNAKIAPLINFTIKGFLWYQGESNREAPELYRKLMISFVSDLRKKWGIGDFPFYYVQIAPFNYEGANGLSAAKLREAQTMNLKDIPNSGMVTTLDIGHPVFIHPLNKETVGSRLALWALGDAYGLKGFSYKPAIYQSMEQIENKIYINFENAPRGLFPMWTQLKGFEIAGEDKVFRPAKAEIETKSCRLAVSSPDVAKPVAVRYAFKNYAEPSLFGLDGIPVPPFRTDNW